MRVWITIIIYMKGKNNMAKLKEHKIYLFCILIFLFFFCRHFSMDFTVGDDAWFANQLSQGTFNYLISRYNNWSSRLIIETVLIYFVHFPKLLFFITDSLMFVLIYYSVLRITNLENNVKALLVLMVIIITFPFDYFGSAGWYATMLNYSWPLGLGLYSLYILCKVFARQNLNMLQKIAYFPCFIYSINQEQFCALMFGFIFILLLYGYFRDKKINKFILVSLLMTVLMLMLHGLCPGNELRKLQESKVYYPEFDDFTLIDKIILGVLSTFSIIISKHVLLVYFFLFSVVASAFFKRNKKIEILSVILFIIYFLLGVILKFNDYIHIYPIEKVSYIIRLFCSNVPEIVISKTMIIYMFSILCFIICLLYCIYKTKNLKICIFVCIIFLASLAARFILGLSASIFASLDRTFINTYFLQIICTMTLLFNETPLLFVSDIK